MKKLLLLVGLVVFLVPTFVNAEDRLKKKSFARYMCGAEKNPCVIFDSLEFKKKNLFHRGGIVYIIKLLDNEQHGSVAQVNYCLHNIKPKGLEHWLWNACKIKKKVKKKDSNVKAMGYIPTKFLKPIKKKNLKKLGLAK